jgi:hypothetical protein
VRGLHLVFLFGTTTSRIVFGRRENLIFAATNEFSIIGGARFDRTEHKIVFVRRKNLIFCDKRIFDSQVLAPY